jgi:hypothetical protein
MQFLFSQLTSFPAYHTIARSYSSAGLLQQANSGEFHYSRHQLFPLQPPSWARRRGYTALSCGCLRGRPAGDASYVELAPLGPLDKSRPQDAVNLMQRTLQRMTLEEAVVVMCGTIT